MFAVLSDPAIYEFENEPPPSEEWLAKRYAKLETRVSQDGDEQWLNWVVRLPEGELAGYVQATVLQSGKAYVAYEFASRFWRQGIGSSAVEAMLNELETQYGVQEFMAVLSSDEIYAGMVYQPVNPGVAYGTLRLVDGPLVLTPAGTMLSAGMKAKAALSKAASVHRLRNELRFPGCRR